MIAKRTLTDISQAQLETNQLVLTAEILNR